MVGIVCLFYEQIEEKVARTNFKTIGQNKSEMEAARLRDNQWLET